MKQKKNLFTKKQCHHKTTFTWNKYTVFRRASQNIGLKSWQAFERSKYPVTRDSQLIRMDIFY